MSKSDNSRIKFEDGYGMMFISDPDHILTYDRISDLYAAFKLLLRKSKNLSVCGNFYRIGNTEIKCTFFLDLAYADQESLDKEEYRYAFKETFPYWSAGFNSLVQSIIFDVQHSDAHTEEFRSVITERVFQHYISGLKARGTIYDDPVQSEIKKRRAERKAADAKRKAAARAKKRLQQNQSHQD